jgi:hypothetical protein
MAIEDLPQRMRELGRLRMGEKALSKNGKPYPVKRTTWRFTGVDAGLLGVIGDLYGGEVEPWPEAPGEGQFFQIKTEANAVRVLIPVGNALSQFYEFWTADGCTRRCTGKVNLIDDSPCVCPSDISERMAAASGLKPTACKPTTRLNVMLPDVPDLGFWRVEAHGYQAAIELPGMLAQYVGLARMYARDTLPDDLILPAELAIESRRVKKPGQPPADFVVPVIRTPQVTPNMLMTGEVPGLASVTPLQIDAGVPPPPALERGSERGGAVGTAPPAPPQYEPFTEADEKIVDAVTARALKATATEAGLTVKDLFDIVARVTGTGCVLNKVLREHWDDVEAGVVEAIGRRSEGAA